MVTPRKPRTSKYLTTPTRPLQVDRDRSVAGLLEKLEGVGFGGKQLAEAHRIWLDMLGDNTTIFLAMSGALIPAGMRRLLAYIIKNRFVDVVVAPGRLLFHDLHETLGRQHFQYHPTMSDGDLESTGVYRMADVLASEEEYREAEEWVGQSANQLDQTRGYSTREFLHLIGRELAEIASEDGVLTSAFKARVPVFCPDLVNSSIGLGVAATRFEKKNALTFDLAQDVLDMMQIAARARVSGVLNLGGGVARSFVRQTEISPYILKSAARGHKYAVTILTEDTEGDGAGATDNEDDLMHGKLARGANTACVKCDVTIALPILVTALSQTAAKYMKGRKRPNFTFTGKDMTVDVQ